MFEEMILYHNILVKILLGLLIVGIIIPFLSKDSNQTIKRLRVYIFFFHGLVTTVAFSGLIAFVFGKIDFNLSILAMIALYIIITVLESLKYLKILKYSDNSKIKITNIKYSMINILLIVALVVWKIVEYKSAVSVP
jgi:hypothetical protein